ncbi:hypothetical protein CPC08DRAFT_716447 [Agrocybe pediades]|nr:hypothetical protein CPC08DRAFT_716447 [Agrocybe pediades]
MTHAMPLALWRCTLTMGIPTAVILIVVGAGFWSTAFSREASPSSQRGYIHPPTCPRCLIFSDKHLHETES